MQSDWAGKTWLSADRLLLAGVLLLALAVRGGAMWALRGNLNADPDAYRQIAENLLHYGVYAMGTGDSPRPTAYRPPLYPIVLSNLPAAAGHSVSLSRVAVLHVLLGVATVWLTWLIARRSLASGFGPSGASWTPAVAALLVACDPILLHQQSLVMTETLATFLAVLALWCLARFGDCRSWFWASLSGGAIGLAVLCRPTFLPWLGLVGLAMFLVRHGREYRMQTAECGMQKGTAMRRQFWSGFGCRVVNVVALGIVAAAVMSPWVIRNYRVFGKPIATTTHGGYTLLLGNNDQFYSWLRTDRSGLPWQAGSLDWEILFVHGTFEDDPLTKDIVFRQDEPARDGALYQMAREAISRQPATFATACLYRITQLWSPLPHKLTADESPGRRWLRYATCAWYCGLYALAAVGVWRLRGRLVQLPWLWGLLLCLAFTAVHTFYWTNLRMRAPLMPFVALVATAALSPGPMKRPGHA